MATTDSFTIPANEVIDEPERVVEFHKYSVREVFEALEKNGFEHLRGEWFTFNDQGLVMGGCVLGQAAINLSAPADGEEEYEIERDPYTNTSMTVANQLDRFKVPFDSKWAVPNHGIPMGAGSLIITWNDKGEYDSALGTTAYALPTYQEVVDMARDILSPFFDKTVYLMNREYQVPKNFGVK